MKRFLRIASLLGLAGLPVLAQAAQPAGWIFGLRGGITTTQTDSGDLDSNLAARGHSIGTDLDSHDTAFVLNLAYRLNTLTAIEASVGTLGEYPAAASGSSPNPSQLAEDLVDEKPAGGRFIGLGLRQDLPLCADKLLLTTRAAVIGWRQESKINNGVTTTKFKDEDAGWMFGLATTYLATPSIGLSLGGDWYDQGSHHGIALLHAGAEYRF